MAVSKALKGKSKSPATIAKIKEARAKQVITTIQITCPHCGLEGRSNMRRWHFDKCKDKV